MDEETKGGRRVDNLRKTQRAEVEYNSHEHTLTPTLSDLMLQRISITLPVRNIIER